MDLYLKNQFWNCADGSNWSDNGATELVFTLLANVIGSDSIGCWSSELGVGVEKNVLILVVGVDVGLPELHPLLLVLLTDIRVLYVAQVWTADMDTRSSLSLSSGDCTPASCCSSEDCFLMTSFSLFTNTVFSFKITCFSDL